MDSSEEPAVDGDILVYKSARDLIPEIHNSLQHLLWRDHNRTRVRKWSLDPIKVCMSLERFLELPQLLDPHLSAWVSSLSKAFLSYLGSYADEYAVEPPARRIPLPRAASLILYQLCNVRGTKTILRMLPNEPKYLVLMLKTLIHWDKAPCFSWEERHIMLFWLSHLIYTPFDLHTISSISFSRKTESMIDLTADLPETAVALCQSSYESLFSPGKERDAASAILIRLSVRPDLHKYNLIQRTFDMMCVTVRADQPDTMEEAHRRIGALTVLAGLLKAAPEKDIFALIQPTFNLLGWIDDEILASCKHTTDAQTRILFVKVVRIGLIRSFASTNDDFCETVLPSVTDFAINAFMTFLEDKDTRVRLASSKALSLATRKFRDLEGGNDESIIDMILAGIESESDVVDRTTGAKVQEPNISQKHVYDLSNVHRRFESAQPLKWHGYMLCLAQLILYRSVPPLLLSRVVRSLFNGLDFHQDSVSGRSMSVQVRDAACFGFWALARKYTTMELEDLYRSDVNSLGNPQEPRVHFIQLVARTLITAACVDPHGNIRRGTSAALQELIGRHPDIVVNGLDLVRLVDYTTVSNRRLAMMTLSKKVSLLTHDYWGVGASALLGWRGVTAPDASSRRIAAEALQYLRSTATPAELSPLLDYIIERLSRLSSKTSFDKRHGLLLALSAVIDNFVSLEAANDDTKRRSSTNIKNDDDMHAVGAVKSKLLLLFQKFKFGSVYVGDRPHGGPAQTLMFEGVCALIASLCRAIDTRCISLDEGSSYPTSLVESLQACLHSNNSTVAVAASKASSELFLTLTEENKVLALESIQSPFKTSAKTEAYLTVLSGLYGTSKTNLCIGRNPPERFHDFLVKELVAATGTSRTIEIRCAALEALANIVSVEARRSIEDSGMVNESLKGIWSDDGLLLVAMTDYTTDHRGDIGSKVRISGLRLLRDILESRAVYFPHTPMERPPEELHSAVRILLKLTAERLDRVRLEAWTVLRLCWPSSLSTLSADDLFADERSVSSIEYFSSLFDLSNELSTFWYSFLEGFVTAAYGGTQGLIRNSRHAIVKFLSSSPPHGCNSIFSTLNAILTSNGGASPNDRYLVPAIHLLAFLLDQGFHPKPLPSAANDVPEQCDLPELHQNVKRAIDTKGRTIARLEAGVYCYEALMLYEETRDQAKSELERLSRLKQTAVKKSADDALFLRGSKQEREKLLARV